MQRAAVRYRPALRRPRPAPPRAAAAVARARPRRCATRRAGRILRRGALGAAGLGALGGAYLALEHIGLDRIGRSLVTSSPTWVLVGLALMCLSMLFRAVSWHAILKAALPDSRPRFTDAWQGTAVGVLMSATLPARLGEPSRALIVARRLGRPREALPVVIGTLVSQTLLNVLALVILGIVDVLHRRPVRRPRAGADLVRRRAGHRARCSCSSRRRSCAPGCPSAPRAWRAGCARRAPGATRVRHGLIVFRRPRMGAAAVTMQLGAWALQLISCYVLMVALGLDTRGAPTSAPRPRCCSRSTSAPCSR